MVCNNFGIFLANDFLNGLTNFLQLRFKNINFIVWFLPAARCLESRRPRKSSLHRLTFLTPPNTRPTQPPKTGNLKKIQKCINIVQKNKNYKLKSFFMKGGGCQEIFSQGLCKQLFPYYLKPE